MIETYLRRVYQPLCVDPLLSFLADRNCSPHLLTLGALVSGLAIVPAMIYQKPWLALALLWVSGFLDTLDGSLARLKREHSSFGAVLDVTSDRVVETAAIVALYLAEPADRGLLCLMMLGSVLLCVTSFLAVGIFLENRSEKSFCYSSGLMERAEAFLFFSAMLLLPALFFPLALLFSALVLLTAALRILAFRLAQKEPSGT